MPSRCFVLNEWVLHDLSGEHGPEAQTGAIRLLEQIKRNGDRIAVLLGSAWMVKAHKLMKASDPGLRLISKFLHAGILRDIRVCQLVDKRDLPDVPGGLRQMTPPDDLYLVETYLAAPADELVTGDHRLFGQLRDSTEIHVRMKDDFVTEYLRTEPRR